MTHLFPSDLKPYVFNGSRLWTCEQELPKVQGFQNLIGLTVTPYKPSPMNLILSKPFPLVEIPQTRWLETTDRMVASANIALLKQKFNQLDGLFQLNTNQGSAYAFDCRLLERTDTLTTSFIEIVDALLDYPVIDDSFYDAYKTRAQDDLLKHWIISDVLERWTEIHNTVIDELVDEELFMPLIKKTITDHKLQWMVNRYGNLTINIQAIAEAITLGEMCDVATVEQTPKQFITAIERSIDLPKGWKLSIQDLPSGREICIWNGFHQVFMNSANVQVDDDSI